ncbi:uncharacterized protein CLUP02_08230 [Colletotrichum lupini]|uniref:Uncharacterized protein n=1 Tax=Colletotrichum lupini TaxID=145971 RepID=A0A9Q8SSR4_9PEZI|nr:uncharacterized protein CLUP02_08230 [Colletotrichum lupini]UQC82740.1 hypothetical protein CLUP02_08230 [Colletotrichum lupini]
MTDFPVSMYPYWQTASVANAHVLDFCHIWNKRLLNLRLRSTPLDPVLVLSVSWSGQLMRIPTQKTSLSVHTVRVALVCLGLKAWSGLLKIIGGPAPNCKGGPTYEIIDDQLCNHGTSPLR